LNPSVFQKIQSPVQTKKNTSEYKSEASFLGRKTRGGSKRKTEM
jgi:hypothetical protein